MHCSWINSLKFWVISESLDNFAYKRCIEGSVGPGSNDNLRIAEAFSHPNKQPVSKIAIKGGRSKIMCFSGAMSAHTTVCLARTDTTASLMTTNTTKTNFTLVAARFMPTQVRNFWLAKLLANHSNSLPNHSISSVRSYWPPLDSPRGLLVIFIVISLWFSGCFTADNKHVEDQFGMITEVHRGCSTFITETVACAHMDYLDGKLALRCQKANQKIQTRITPYVVKRAHPRATTPVIP